MARPSLAEAASAALDSASSAASSAARRLADGLVDGGATGSGGAGPSQQQQHAFYGAQCPEVRIDIPFGGRGGCDGPDIDRWLEPRRPEDGVMNCRVRRLRDKNTLELYVEAGHIFMLAAVKSGKDWLITEQQSDCAKRQHVARLRFEKERSFTCIRRSAEGYDRPNQLLLCKHTTIQLSESLPELNTMRLALPKPPLGLTDSPWGQLEDKLKHVTESMGRAPDDLTILESRKPKWNSRSDTYELPFGGRANWASARNFQLCERGGSDRVVLLYGKMEEDEFAMDFSAPLSVLHAFATVLTTWGW